MSDGEQLLLIVSLIYLSGCLFWVDRRTILFSSWFGGRWRSITTDYRWGNTSGSIYLLNPFPPLGFVFTSRLLPVSVSPANIVAYNVQTIGNSGRMKQSGKVAAISSTISFSRHGTELWIDGKNFCDIGNIVTAHKLVVLLNKIKSLNMDEREKVIESFWLDRLALRSTKKTVRLALEICGFLRQFSAMVVLVLFSILPMIAVRYNVGFSVLIGAMVMIVSAFVICSRYFVYHRSHYPLFKIGLGGDLVKMALCPPTALRVCDLIMGRFSGRLDALPLAVLLLKGESRGVFLQEYVSDLQAPDVPDGLPDVVRDTCLWQTRTILKAGTEAIPMLRHFMKPISDSVISSTATEHERKESENGRE